MFTHINDQARDGIQRGLCGTSWNLCPASV